VSRSLLLSLLVLAGCRREEPARSPLPSVRVTTVAPQQVEPRIPIAGVLAPLPGKDVKVGALVPGRVDRMFVAEGDRVKVGQPLAHVEAAPLQQRVAEVEAQKEQARAQVENARGRLARSERLWKDGIASRQEVDDARAAFVAAESALKQAQALGGTATVQLERATLRAPIAGIVAAILVPAGQPVDGNGVPVVEVADTSVLDLRAPVPAARVGEVVVGDRAQLAVEGVGTIDGVVEALAPLVDTATNTVIVRVKIVNPTGRLRGGMFARGALLRPPRLGLVVPASALLPGDGGAATQLALVGGDNVVTRRDVRIGAEIGEGVEILTGLSAGERVVVAGGYTLPSGVQVEILP
jgi:RND family efflux transporter MFP subunit